MIKIVVNYTVLADTESEEEGLERFFRGVGVELTERGMTGAMHYQAFKSVQESPDKSAN
jgi:hypothetical protein